MRLPNLFQTRNGRFAAFFLLYVTEGIPLGFAATAVATQLRRQGVGPAEIGAFIGLFYLPWAFKWAFGPIVDVFAIERLGRRRGWILGTQIVMVATLFATSFLKLPEQLWLFSAILLVHNTFSATQDVAIDALAINTLNEHERATASGVMFAGASIGQMIGGSGALLVTSWFGFQSSFYFVSAAILLVTLFVVLPMKEAASAPRVRAAGSAMAAAGREMREFAVTAFKSFMGTRGAFVGLFMSLLPPGAMCLGLALQSNLAVELGMDDGAVATMNFWSTLIGAAGCLSGGLIADRFDRRRALTWYILLMSIPVFVMSLVLQHFNWIMPLAPDAAKPVVPALLMTAFWVTTLVYAYFNGMMYSATTAIFMDVTNPVVAGTQFTAYMAMFNLAISYSATWQGISIEAWGYPGTMIVDGFYGMLYLLVLPLTRKRPGSLADDNALAPGRARKLGLVLAMLCLAWLPVHALESQFGAAKDIVNILFTLVFIASALFLLAGAALLGAVAGRLTRIGAWFSPLLLLMQVRNYQDGLAAKLGVSTQSLGATLDIFLYGVPLLAAVLLWQMSRHAWTDLALPSTTGDKAGVDGECAPSAAKLAAAS